MWLCWHGHWSLLYGTSVLLLTINYFLTTTILVIIVADCQFNFGSLLFYCEHLFKHLFGLLPSCIHSVKIIWHLNGIQLRTSYRRGVCRIEFWYQRFRLLVRWNILTILLIPNQAFITSPTLFSIFLCLKTDDTWLDNTCSTQFICYGSGNITMSSVSCSDFAECTIVDGSYQCVCTDGYAGTGFVCESKSH